MGQNWGLRTQLGPLQPPPPHTCAKNCALEEERMGGSTAVGRSRGLSQPATRCSLSRPGPGRQRQGAAVFPLLLFHFLPSALSGAPGQPRKFASASRVSPGRRQPPRSAAGSSPNGSSGWKAGAGLFPPRALCVSRALCARRPCAPPFRFRLNPAAAQSSCAGGSRSLRWLSLTSPSPPAPYEPLSPGDSSSPLPWPVYEVTSCSLAPPRRSPSPGRCGRAAPPPRVERPLLAFISFLFSFRTFLASLAPHQPIWKSPARPATAALGGQSTNHLEGLP